MKGISFLFLFLLCFISGAQTTGKTMIAYCRPHEGDSISTNIGSMPEGEEPGPKRGEKVDYFKLYGLNRDSLDIKAELTKGKPVLVFSGSFTCPHYRNQSRFFDSLLVAHQNDISIFMVYVIEAHPSDPDPSPYMKRVAVHQRNVKEGINYHQPKTYAERRWLAKQMVYHTGLKVPVVIDSPNNNWLQTFGTLPNIAYLIDTDGTVAAKYLDYEVYKNIILEDIKSLISKKKSKPD